MRPRRGAGRVRQAVVRAGRGPRLDRRVPGADRAAAAAGAQDRLADGHGRQQGRAHRDPGDQDRHPDHGAVDPRQGDPGARRRRAVPGLPARRRRTPASAPCGSPTAPTRCTRTRWRATRSAGRPPPGRTDDRAGRADELRQRVARLPRRPRPGHHGPAGVPPGPLRRGAGLGHFPRGPRRARPARSPAGRGGRPVRGGRRARQQPAQQRDRARHGRADDPRLRHRRAEAALPAAAVDRRGDLVPAVQRARRRIRPRRVATRAVRDGTTWVVNGQKVWTSGAHFARFGDPGGPHRPGRSPSTAASPTSCAT